MMNVISSEIYKIFRSKIFYALVIIFSLMNIICDISAIRAKFSGADLDTGLYMYKGTYNADGIFHIILIFTAFLITSEYSNGTIRQISCRGIERWKLVLGQYIAIAFILTIAIFSLGIINLLVFTLIFELGEVELDSFVRMNFGLLSLILGTTGIGTFLSYLFKNVGITILTSIFSVIGSPILMGVLTNITKNNIFEMYSFSNMRKVIIDFSSNAEQVINYSIVFLIIALISISASCILFSKRDVN